MRLSEAILLGSVGTEQGFGPDSIYKESPGKCALGAALIAVGYEYQYTDFGAPYRKLRELWPYAVSFLVELWQKNDYEKWTRPQIAAWVAEQEVRLGIVDQVEEQVQEGDYAISR